MKFSSEQIKKLREFHSILYCNKNCVGGGFFHISPQENTRNGLNGKTLSQLGAALLDFFVKKNDSVGNLQKIKDGFVMINNLDPSHKIRGIFDLYDFDELIKDLDDALIDKSQSYKSSTKLGQPQG